MSSLTGPLRVEQIPHTKSWILLSPLRYDIGDLGSGDSVIVPVGVRTDFASIPQPCWSIIGHPAGLYAAAAVVHDFLTQHHGGPHPPASGLHLPSRYDGPRDHRLAPLGDVGRGSRWWSAGLEPRLA